MERIPLSNTAQNQGLWEKCGSTHKKYDPQWGYKEQNYIIILGF